MLASRPLSPIEQMSVAASLSAAEAGLFWEQKPIDQRHAYTVAVRVEGSVGEDPEAVAAALLHDIGKRHTSAGLIGRSLATVADMAGMPLPTDWRRYRNHGSLGSADLEGIGATGLSVAFAAGDNRPPAGTDPTVWEALHAADDA